MLVFEILFGLFFIFAFYQMVFGGAKTPQKNVPPERTDGFGGMQ